MSCDSGRQETFINRQVGPPTPGSPLGQFPAVLGWGGRTGTRLPWLRTLRVSTAEAPLHPSLWAVYFLAAELRAGEDGGTQGIGGSTAGFQVSDPRLIGGLGLRLGRKLCSRAQPSGTSGAEPGLRAQPSGDLEPSPALLPPEASLSFLPGPAPFPPEAPPSGPPYAPPSFRLKRRSPSSQGPPLFRRRPRPSSLAGLSKLNKRTRGPACACAVCRLPASPLGHAAPLSPASHGGRGSRGPER